MSDIDRDLLRVLPAHLRQIASNSTDPDIEVRAPLLNWADEVDRWDPHDGYTCAETEERDEKLTDDFNTLAMFVSRDLVKLYQLWFKLSESCPELLQSAVYRVCAGELKKAIQSRSGGAEVTE